MLQVDTLFVHSNFDPDNYVDDIAMIQLAEEVDINAFVRPVCLPAFNASYHSQTCVITGWGAAYTGEYSLMDK